MLYEYHDTKSPDPKPSSNSDLPVSLDYRTRHGSQLDRVKYSILWSMLVRSAPTTFHTVGLDDFVKTYNSIYGLRHSEQLRGQARLEKKEAEGEKAAFSGSMLLRCLHLS
jgi:hypothetical protein